MSVTPLRPATVGATANPSTNSAMGPAGTESFVIKLQRYAYGFSVPVEETTGDGDAYPYFDITPQLYGDMTFYGIAVSNVAMGLQNLADTTKNPTASITFLLSSTREINIKLVIRSFRGFWNRKSVTVPVVIQGSVHNTAPSAVES